MLGLSPILLETPAQATEDQTTAVGFVNTALRVYAGRLENQQQHPGQWEVYDFFWMQDTLTQCAGLWPTDCQVTFSAGQAEIMRLTREAHNIPLSFY